MHQPPWTLLTTAPLVGMLVLLAVGAMLCVKLATVRHTAG